MSEGSTVLFSRHGASQATRPESFRLGRTCTDWIVCPYLDTPIIQRKVLTPNDFADLEAVRLRLALYEELSNQNPMPFQWKFDRTKLTALLAKIEARHRALADAQLTWLEEAA